MHFIQASSDEVLKLFALFQYLEKTSGFKTNGMVFGDLDTIECWFAINGVLTLRALYYWFY